MNDYVLEELIVVKRSGQRVNFNGPKIAVAIKHAFDSIYSSYNEKFVNDVYEDVLGYIKKNYVGRKTINVEDIQDIIEQQLKLNKFEDVYESFNKYRLNRKASREVFLVKPQHKFVKAVEKLVNYTTLEPNKKSKDLILDFGKTISNELAKSYLIDAKYIRNHEEGNIYIHNIDSFMQGIPQSFHISSKDDLENIIMNGEKEVSKELSIPAIDSLLVDYVIDRFKIIYKNLLFKYLKLQGFYEYLNIRKIEDMIDKNNTIFEIDLCAFQLSDKTKDTFNKAYQDAIVDLKDHLEKKFRNVLNKAEGNFTFSLGINQSIEGQLISNIYLDYIEEVENSHITTIFKVKKHINIDPKDKNYYLLEKVTNLILQGKNIKIAYLDTSYNNNDVEYFKDGKRVLENINSVKQVSTGRMILATTSINLVRLGLRNKNVKDFYIDLTDTLELVKNELLLDFESKGDMYKSNFTYLFNSNVLDDDKLEENQKIRKVIKNGTLNIGLIGLKECIYALTDKEDIDLLMDILKFIKTKCNKFIEETKLNFTISEIIDDNILKEVITLDKSIYGLMNNVTNKKLYESINTIKKDLKTEATIYKLLNGGYVMTLDINNKLTPKKLIEKIESLYDMDIGFITFKEK